MLQQIWKPASLILSATSFIYFVKDFYHRSGRFFPGTVVLFALAIALLFTVPIKSIRLLAKRTVAFVLDLAILALITYAVCDLLFRYQAVKPCGLVSLVVMWAWLFFTIFCDWQFSGTPGKLLLGLRLKSQTAATLNFVKCLLRSLLILVVPLTIAGRITGILTYSKAISFVLWSAALAILSFLPLSMAISGGQSAVDLLLRTSVLPRQSSLKQYPASLDRQKWLVLVFASLAFGTVLAYTSFPGLGSLGAEFKKPSFPTLEARRSGEAEALTAAALRAYMLRSPNNIDSEIEDFKLYTVLGKPAGDVVENTPAARECASAFKLGGEYKIIYAKVDRESLTVVKMFLWQNLMSLSPLYSTRPGYLVFEIVNRETFGAFDIESYEKYTFCEVGTGKEAGQQLVGGSPGIAILSSVQLPSLLFLADLARYSEIERVPILPK